MKDLSRFKVDPNERAEVSAFVCGFLLALTGIHACVGRRSSDEEASLIREARELALDLYPNFDAPPEPVKARLGGVS